MRLVSKGNVIRRGDEDVVCGHYPCLNMGAGYQAYRVLRPGIWGRGTADLVPPFPRCSLNPTLSLI